MADLADGRTVPSLVQGVNAIVHFASYPREAAWSVLLDANLRTAINLWEAAAAAGVQRIVYASSHHAVGYYPRSARIDARVPSRPDGRYGLAKVFMEALAQMHADKHGLRAFGMRLGYCGPEPLDTPHLSHWLHPEDLAQLIGVGITAPSTTMRSSTAYRPTAASGTTTHRAERLGDRPASTVPTALRPSSSRKGQRRSGGRALPRRQLCRRGSSSGGRAGQPPVRCMKTIVYVSNAASGEISGLNLDVRTGNLSELQTVAVGGLVMPMAVSPDRRFLYVARRSDPMAAVTLAIDATGLLTKVGEAALPASMACIAIERNGRFLLAASYQGHQLTVSAISADGLVQPVHQVVRTGPNAHMVRVDATNRFVFATSLGGGHLMQLRFDALKGMLTPNDPPHVDIRTGAGPRHLDIHPNGGTVYLLNELDASLDVLALEPNVGTLSHLQTVSVLLPPGFEGKPWAADLHVTPYGRWLIASERRSSTLAVFSVDLASGQLTPVGNHPTQAQPRGFAIDPSGQYVVVAGEGSDTVGVHALGPGGMLDAGPVCAVGRGPNWVEIVELH